MNEAELNAEIAALNDDLQRTATWLHEAEKERDEWRARFETETQIRREWAIRAESAEARVKELEARTPRPEAQTDRITVDGITYKSIQHPTLGRVWVGEATEPEAPASEKEKRMTFDEQIQRDMGYPALVPPEAPASEGSNVRHDAVREGRRVVSEQNRPCGGCRWNPDDTDKGRCWRAVPCREHSDPKAPYYDGKHWPGHEPRKGSK